MGAGPPLLFLDGRVRDRGSWQSVAHRLARDFTVVTRVRAAGPRGPWAADRPAISVAQRADEAADLLRAHQLAPAMVVGHGPGCCTAYELVAHHPGLVRQAVAIEPQWIPTWAPDVDRLRASGIPLAVIVVEESPGGRSDATVGWLAAAGARRYHLPPAGPLIRPDTYVALIRDIARDSGRQLHPGDWSRVEEFHDER
jgi:pimeloyl-ACP methyl ester carboxylesterase